MKNDHCVGARGAVSGSKAMSIAGAVLLQAVVASALVMGCGSGTPANELPMPFRGPYEMVRLMGTDNATITAGPNSLSMAGCDVNCPDPVLQFTTITCSTAELCNVAGPECTGTIELASMGDQHYLEIALTPVPGATGDAVEHRQVNCYQYGGSTEYAAQ